VAEVTASVPIPLPELKPNPDPTDRTTDQLRREITMLREIIEQRLDGYDRAIKLIQAVVDREPKPPVLQSEIMHVRDMLDKLDAVIDVRFAERDKRMEQRMFDAKTTFETAIASIREGFAAQHLSAQNAIGKSEAAIAKQMDQIESKFGTEIKALHTSISDLKDRMTAQEQVKIGVRESKTEFGEKFGYVVAAIATIIAVIGFTMAFNTTGKTTTVIERERPVVNAPASGAQ
jgi:hypothetical protein